jgi:hypothetical protein
MNFSSKTMYNANRNELKNDTSNKQRSKMKIQFRQLMVTLALAITACGAVTISPAQDDILNKQLDSVEFQNADLREALKSIFNQVGANYSIPPTIQGTVTASFKKARFETVLQNLLQQVNATYRYDAGVFMIVLREETAPPVDGTDTGEAPKAKTAKIIRKVYIRSADPMLIAMLLGGNGGSQNYFASPEPLAQMGMMGGGMGGGMMGGGMGGGMMGGMGGGMMGGMGGGMGGGMMGGGMMGGMGGGMGGGMMGGGMGGGMMGGFWRNGGMR